MNKKIIRKYTKVMSFFLIFFISHFILDGVFANIKKNHTENSKINWKFFFNKLFALEIKKGNSDNEKHPFLNTSSLLKQHTSWSPLRFEQVISETLKANNSREAYEIREKIYRDKANYDKISNLDFKEVIPEDILERPRIKSFIDSIYNQKLRKVLPGENFLSSPEGKNMIEAFSYAGLSKKQKVAFVIVPGYAAHLIKFPIFEEIMRDANLYYGRAALRPVLKEETMVDFEFMDYITYYSKQNGKKNNFDILSLAGWENGNTVGKNLKSTKLLVKWLKTLPKMYKDHKLVLLGYSKGAGVVLDVVRESPELRKRIIGYVTYAGVIQGTGIARTAMKTLNELIGDKSLGEIVDKVNEQKGNELFKKLTPLLLSSPTAFYKMPVIKGVLKQFDIEYTPIEKMSKRVMEGLEIRTLMDGAIDLSPLVRTRWNLLYSNNQFFNPGTFIFNLSAITDISTFARPGGIIKNGEKQPNLLAPTITDKGKIDWKNFSLDSIFLYLSSIDGFRGAPGGLYDTQVELGNTKSFLTDSRPLAFSLSLKELKILWDNPRIKEKLKKNGVEKFTQFIESPRNKLFKNKNIDHIGAFDLGEIRGHHWSNMVQALRPPMPQKSIHASWSFPRKAYMRALLQTMAFYNLVLHL